MPLVLDIWLSVSMLISFFAVIGIFIFGVVFLADTDEKDNARYLWRAIGVFFLSWTWPVVVPYGIFWVGRKAWRTAELEIRLPDWRRFL